MRVAVMQSSYIPWKGYFDLIHGADLFIFYDDVQFTKNDWRNRNQIKTPNGLLWLSVPVGQNISRRICDVKIEDHKWQEKHFKTLRQYYSNCEFWKDYEGWITDLYYRGGWNNLSELNQWTMKSIADELSISVEWKDSRDYKLEGQKEARLLNLLKQVGCTEYISTPAAKGYIKEEDFRAAGISLRWTDVDDFPEYSQPYPPFVHRVSILDLLLTEGPKAPYFIWGHRSTVKLVPVSKEDLELIFSWRNNPEIYKWTYLQKEPNTWEEHLRNWNKFFTVRTSYMVVFKGRKIGYVQSYEVKDGQTEVAIFIGDVTSWGQGLGKEAMKKFLDILGGRKLVAEINKNNERSKRLFESLGFKLVGNGREGEVIYERGK